MLGQWAPGPGGPQPGQEEEDEEARDPPWPLPSSQRRAAARRPAPAMPLRAARAPRPAARPPAALRLRARHRGRVLLAAVGQWARRAETIQPMGAPLGPRGREVPGRGGAAYRPPPPSPCGAQGSLAPFGLLVPYGGSSRTREVGEP